METSRNITRRDALGLLAGGIVASSASSAFPSVGKPAKKPNVVFVLMDDVGYGDLACLGNPVIKTPNIDALWGKSARFTDFHVSPTCSPSRCSLMTGRYCNEVGVWHTIHGRNLLSPDAVTLAECFKSSGYRTANYGKWHLGDNYPCRPQDRGFDDAVVCGGGGIWQAPDYFGNDDVDDSYIHNGKFEKYRGFSTDIFFQLTMDFHCSMPKRTMRRFSVYLATPAAHEPVWAKEKDAAPYEGVAGLPHAGFYGMIANIDENLGRLMHFLEDQQLAEDTILIFSSDNGTGEGDQVFNAGMRGSKSAAYEGGHRVPLFFYWPVAESPREEIFLLSPHTSICCQRWRTFANSTIVATTSTEVVATRCFMAISDRWADRTIVIDSQREENLVKWKDTVVMTQQWRLVNPTPHGNPNRLELYDIAKDPGSTGKCRSATSGCGECSESRLRDLVEAGVGRRRRVCQNRDRQRSRKPHPAKLHGLAWRRLRHGQ